jgi:cbb3-type cytochrome c oxidase subunit III
MGRNKWAAVFLIAALAACAKDDDAADDNAVDNTGAAATQPATDAPATAAPAGNMPAGVTADMVSQGQTIFTSTGNCYTCHGPDAKGTALAPNLTDQEWLNISGTYPEIQNVVKTGVPTPKSHPAPMPAMGGAQLTDDQINQVASYVWSLGGGK